MASPDDFLSNIYSQDLLDAHKAASMTAYEERIVKKLLVRVGLQGTAKELAMKAKEKTGKARLTFSWFYEEHPSFPIYLSMKKVPWTFQVSVKDLFNNFCSTPMFKAWEEFNDEIISEDKPVGLVFDWPGVKTTQMIMHNSNPTFDFDNRMRIIRSVGRGKKVQPITVEQFEPFLDNVLKMWSP